MTKQELVRDLKSTFSGAGLISINDISRYTTLERKAVIRMMTGIEYCSLGRKKLYTVNDVADVLISLRN